MGEGVTHAHRSDQQRLVVGVRNVGAINAFLPVLLKLPLEDVLVEKVLQLLVGQVDAQLLKAAVNQSCAPRTCHPSHLFFWKCSKPKMSRMPTLNGLSVVAAPSSANASPGASRLLM